MDKSTFRLCKVLCDGETNIRIPAQYQQNHGRSPNVCMKTRKV